MKITAIAKSVCLFALINLVSCSKRPVQNTLFDATPNSSAQTPTPAALSLPRNVPLVDTEILDKLRSKLDPSLLENSGYAAELFFMRQPQVYDQYRSNEFEWPQRLAAFQRNTLSWSRSAPAKFRVLKSAKLGTYNQQKHAFPLLNWLSDGPLVPLNSIDISYEGHRRWPSGNFAPKDRNPGNTKFHLQESCVVVFLEPFLMTDLPVEVDRAKALIEELKDLGKDRIIELAIDIEPSSVDYQSNYPRPNDQNFEGLNYQFSRGVMTGCMILKARLAMVTAYYRTNHEGKFFDNYEEKVLGAVPVTPVLPKQ